jgi:hypothetical protein
METRVARVTVRATVLLAVTAVVAVVTGLPFVFPSLGPSAYALATARERAVVTPDVVLGGHAIGVVAGLLAYHALAPGLTVTADLGAFSVPTARLGASGVVSVGLTTAGMLVTDRVHPPACATTLIVALGILPTVRESVVVLVAVACLLGADAATTALAARVTMLTNRMAA